MQKFMETPISDNFSQRLSDERNYTIGANHADKVAKITFTAVGDCLKKLVSKETLAAFRFIDVKDVIAVAVLAYHPNEDPNQPGNWSYIWSFEEEDIPKNAVIMDNTSVDAYRIFSSVAMGLFKMGYEEHPAMIETSNYLLKTIKKYLIDNATAEAETGVELEGVFQARSKVENDGEVVCSIEIIGETKALIKSDAGIEI